MGLRALAYARASDTEHRPLEFLQTQVIFKLARVFQQIDLRMAVRAETNLDAVFEVSVRGHHTVAEISLGRGTGANHRAGFREGRNGFGRHMNRVHRGESFA